MRRFRVISCLASSTQQMNSLRANGVMSFQAASAVELAISASRRSAGSSCTTPPGTRLLLTGARVTPMCQVEPMRCPTTLLARIMPVRTCSLEVAIESLLRPRRISGRGLNFLTAREGSFRGRHTHYPGMPPGSIRASTEL
jgi:hypothetical protein